MRGYLQGRFSFNVKGGRCEACAGDGTIKIEMNFLPDVYVPCEVCHGARYNRETLEVHYKGKTIAEVLDMPIEEAVDFFAAVPPIARHMKTLVEVGLGYVRLGQPATTLSGGEAQRVKLSSELQKRSTGGTVYVLDEPTTGLHFEDIRKLLLVLGRLVDQGNTVLVIEHNLDVIKTADWIVDMGPEGGSRGGTVARRGHAGGRGGQHGELHRPVPQADPGRAGRPRSPSRPARRPPRRARRPRPRRRRPAGPRECFLIELTSSASSTRQRALAKVSTMTQVSRRTVTGLATAGLSLPLLAACSSDDPDTASDPGTGTSSSDGGDDAQPGRELLGRWWRRRHRVHVGHRGRRRHDLRRRAGRDHPAEPRASSRRSARPAPTRAARSSRCPTAHQLPVPRQPVLDRGRLTRRRPGDLPARGGRHHRRGRPDHPGLGPASGRPATAGPAASAAGPAGGRARAAPRRGGRRGPGPRSGPPRGPRAGRPSPRTGGLSRSRSASAASECRPQSIAARARASGATTSRWVGWRVRAGPGREPAESGHVPDRQQRDGGVHRQERGAGPLQRLGVGHPDRPGPCRARRAAPGVSAHRKSSDPVSTRVRQPVPSSGLSWAS